MTIPRPDAKMLDDLARVAGGAVNIFSGFQEQIKNDVRARVDDMAARLDLVPRDELDQARAMIEKLRRDMKALEARIDALESGKKAKPATKAPIPKTKAKAKPATKKKSR